MTHTCRLQRDILTVFPSSTYKNWESVPKFLAMRKYPTDIRQYGMTDLYTSGPKESYVKVLRQAWQHTNKHTDSVDQQVLGNLALVSKRKTEEKDESDNLVGKVVVWVDWLRGRSLASSLKN
jgi:hypothetical protein